MSQTETRSRPPSRGAAGRCTARSTADHIFRTSCCFAYLLLPACSVYGEQLERPDGVVRDAQVHDGGTDDPRPHDRTPGFDAVDTNSSGNQPDVSVDSGPSVADAGQPEADGVALPDSEGEIRDVEAGIGDVEGGIGDVEGGSRDAEAEMTGGDAPALDDAKQDGGCTGSTIQHDEDGDGVLDGCDNCPSVANADQADLREAAAGSTADGVGDACDPRPTLGGDSIALFDSLASVQIGTEWVVYAGMWRPGNDTLAETATGDSQEIDRVTFPAAADYIAETRLTLDALPTIDSRATLAFRIDTSLHNGWGCAVSNRSLLAVSTIVNGDQGEPNPPQTAIPAPRVGDRIRIQAGAHGANIFCLLPDTGQRVTRSSVLYPNGVAGLRTHQAACTFEYLLVYRLGGPLP